MSSASRTSRRELTVADLKARLASAYDMHGDKVRFLVVGAFNTAFGYTLFLAVLALTRLALRALAHVDVPYVIEHNYFLIAQWTAWVMSVPVGTLTLKHFVFHGTGRTAHEIRRAYFVYFPGTVASSVLLWLTVHTLGLAPEIGQLITILAVVWMSYLGHKYFTFGDSRERAG